MDVVRFVPIVAAVTIYAAVLTIPVCLAILLREHRRALTRMRAELKIYESLLAADRRVDWVCVDREIDDFETCVSLTLTLKPGGVALKHVMRGAEIEELISRIRCEAARTDEIIYATRQVRRTASHS